MSFNQDSHLEHVLLSLQISNCSHVFNFKIKKMFLSICIIFCLLTAGVRRQTQKQHDLNIYFYEFQLQWFAKSWGGWPSTKIWFMFLLRFNLKIEGGKMWIENARMYINFFRTSSKVHCGPKQQDSLIFYYFTSSPRVICKFFIRWPRISIIKIES